MVYGDEVFLFDFFGGVGESLGEVSVVCEDDEAFGFLVEAAYVVEVLECGWEAGVDGFAFFLIGFGTDDPARFVEEDGGGVAREDAFVVDFHEVFLGDLEGHVGGDFTINDDEAFFDEFVA